ncbi:hypothetical protein LCGC14_0726390 [marine sediment metagenome]|uniref:Uncharacterized protein n=1 Tax=marine sediment metagenome TaxID=412755 RepID=A0A0F9QF18_9ZZZZ
MEKLKGPYRTDSHGNIGAWSLYECASARRGELPTLLVSYQLYYVVTDFITISHQSLHAAQLLGDLGDNYASISTAFDQW